MFCSFCYVYVGDDNLQGLWDQNILIRLTLKPEEDES